MMSSAKLAHPQQFPAPCSFLELAIQTHTHVGGMCIGVQYPATDAARKTTKTRGLHLHTCWPSLLHSPRLSKQTNPVKCPQPRLGHLPRLTHLTLHNYCNTSSATHFPPGLLSDIASESSHHMMHCHQPRGVRRLDLSVCQSKRWQHLKPTSSNIDDHVIKSGRAWFHPPQGWFAKFKVWFTDKHNRSFTVWDSITTCSDSKTRRRRSRLSNICFR